ncbi:hypothetical protein [Duganella sp. Root1480D1]|uniref:hypothetical protein n=1 Tax=Duganella sp. Root1480D1 TaxID=1736471 RepID=UPI00071070E4|nr:hypothetical protein [Duganella sp. Root1480D1]KQZ43942.1 hypothetical protein ASD58_19505 [Duganella sp. Root1480D1]
MQLATAHATSVLAPPPCIEMPITISLPGQRPPDRESHIRQYLDKESARCAGQHASSAEHAVEDVPILVRLMRKGESPAIRRQAAETIGWLNVDQRSPLEELSTGISEEADAEVVNARIRGVGMLLPSFSDPRWNSEIRLSEILGNIDDISYNDARSEQDRALINAAIADVLEQQVRQLDYLTTWPPEGRKVGASDWQQVVGETSLIIHRRQGHAHLLKALEQAFGSGTPAVGPEQEAAWLLDLLDTLGAPDPELRAAASGLVQKLLTRLAALRDPVWQDFHPYLSKGALDRLTIVARAGVGDSDAKVRANSVGMLGILGSPNELVAALDDEELVREYAAFALARQTTVPGDAVPRLLRMARKGNEASLAAIAALSQVREFEVMQALLDILLKSSTGSEFEEKRAVTAVRALSKFGLQAALPVLSRADRANDEFAQQHLYEVLVNVGWEQLGKAQAAQVAEALTPALVGEDELSRLFALSLLARLPVSGAQQYDNALVDRLVGRYLWVTQKEITKAADVPADIRRQTDRALKYAWNSSWAMPPQRAVSIVAGHSSSALAAQRMVAWLCAAPGLQQIHRAYIDFYTSGSGEPAAIEAMGASLNQMGPLARPLVETAQGKDKRKQCRFGLAGVGI